MGIAATLAIEALILLILLSLGVHTGPPPPAGENVTTFDAREAAVPEAAEEAQPEQADASTPVPVEPRPPSPLTPQAQPPTALPRESTVPIPPPAEAPAPPQPQPVTEPPAPPRARAVIRPGANIGPADTGRRGGEDSQIVGTAPDGSPLYAARWYTEPTDQQMEGYLAGARGPGWGLIACRTAPGWRVQDCVVLGESPAGSNMGNAANAASWQYLVRPPRVGGEYQVGAWVRIRIIQGSGLGPRG